MDLKGKKLLLMGGSAYAQSIKKYSSEKGFSLVAVGNIPDTPHKRIADIVYDVDTQDIERVVEIVHKEHCDGIFVGASEANVVPAITVAEQTNTHFYTDRKCWDILSNKRSFKRLLNKHGVETVKEFHVTDKFLEEELNQIQYPVIVKPVDGSAAHGISICTDDEQLKEGYRRACEISATHSAIVEQYIVGMDDMFIHYTIAEGKISLSCTFDRHLNYSQSGFTGMAVGYTYPSMHTSEFKKNVDSRIKEAFRDIGIQNGAINIQCLTDGNHFYFYEAGYRLGGEQMYFFTEKLNGINVCNLMIHQALTGKMSDDPEILAADNPFFSKPCLSLYVPLKPGKIKRLEGVSDIRKLDGILNVTEMCGVGDIISRDGSLSQVCLRMHIMQEEIEALAETVDAVNRLLGIYDEDDNDMVLEYFDLRHTKYYEEYSNMTNKKYNKQ